MASPTHDRNADLVPLWLVTLLGVAWLLVTLGTIAYVGALGPLA